MEILVERPTPERLEALGVRSWPVWTKEPSTFDWFYDDAETCYLLAGRVRVEPEGGGPAVDIGAGDLVTFPQGLACVWKVTEAVRKHYRFG
ncbi:MAG: cupin domain-containing protein [Planctomycetes bacterium]|nr:cupin domain-containing protein [Planctomycetota bacterium]